MYHNEKSFELIKSGEKGILTGVFPYKREIWRVKITGGLDKDGPPAKVRENDEPLLNKPNTITPCIHKLN